MSPFPSKAPVYREYYPRFDIRVALAALRKGQPICEFSTGAFITGQLLVVDYRPDESVEIELEVGMPHVASPGLTRILIRPIEDRLDDSRVLMLCPTCRRRRFVLWCVRHWACDRCHRLFYRSQVIDRLAGRWEKIRTLKERVGRGRPAGMQRRTYAKLRAELAEHEALADKQGRGRRRAHVDIAFDHEIVLARKWLKPMEVRDNWFLNYTFSGGVVTRREI